MWNARAVRAAAGARRPLQPLLALENILLLQLHAGILFALFMTMALWARGANSGFHKRMIFLATAMPLLGVDRPHGVAAEHLSGKPDGDRRLYPAGGGAAVRVGRDPEPAGARSLSGVDRDLSAGVAARYRLWDTPGGMRRRGTSWACDAGESEVLAATAGAVPAVHARTSSAGTEYASQSCSSATYIIGRSKGAARRGNACGRYWQQRVERRH